MGSFVDRWIRIERKGYAATRSTSASIPPVPTPFKYRITSTVVFRTLERLRASGILAVENLFDNVDTNAIMRSFVVIRGALHHCE